MSRYTLEFENYVDLQTRLVLLPNQDDDCIGAKIHSYIPGQNESVAQLKDPSNTPFVGSILVDIEGNTQTENEVVQEDFTSILSAIRVASSPIVLHFIHPPPESQGLEERDTKEENDYSYYHDSDSDQISEISMSSSEDVDLAGELKNKLSRWGTKFADAAEKYASHAVKASKELTKDKANGIANGSQYHDNTVSPSIHPPCGLYLQTSSGKCVPLQEASTKPKHDVRFDIKGGGVQRRNFFSKKPTVTNTSVLVIRKSADIACPHLGFTYQWFRSYTVEPSLSECDSKDAMVEWIPMDHETSIIYQPTTTDVGHRVKCIVSIKQNEEETIEVVCELPFAIECDKTLFDVAYKSFAPDNAPNGTMLCTFDNLHWTDELQDSGIIVIHLCTKRYNEEKKKSGFQMILQSESSALNDFIGKPMLNVLARSYASAAKSFVLGIENPSQDGTYIHLKFDAPSRIARETFLITLGIARFDGDLKDLNTRTKLFPERPPLERDFCTPNWKLSNDNSFTNEEVIRNEPAIMETPEKMSETTKLTPFNSKMMALESELEEDLGILRDKLESKNKVVLELHEEIKMLKNDKISSSEQLSELKRLLHLSEEKIKNLEESFEKEKNAKESYRNKFVDQSKQMEMSKSEFEKTLKSLENEKAVLAAAVEARERKLDNFKEMKDELASLKQKLQEKEKQCNELMDSRNTINDLKDKLNDSSMIRNELEAKLKKMEHDLETALSEVQKERDLSNQSKIESDKLKTLLQTMKGERNSFKQKADSLAKEMSRLRKSDVEARNYERSQEDYKRLQDEVISLRSERRAIKDELEATKMAHAAYIQAQQQAGEDIDLIRSLNKCSELERVISDMTEYLHAKEMQLETIQSANRKLCEEIIKQKKSNNDV